MSVELKAIASLDGKPFETTINKMGNNVDRLKTGPLAGLKGMIAGAFTIGAITAFGRKLLQTADDMVTAAQSFGISIENIIAIKTAMAESGIGADKFLTIFGKLTMAVGEAKDGVESYVMAFHKMNIAQRELAGLDPSETLELMAKKFAETAEKTTFLEGALMAIHDKRLGPQLIEVLQRINTEGLEKFREESVAAAEGIKELAKASDLLEATKNKFIVWAATAIGALASVREKIKEFNKEGFGPDWKRGPGPRMGALTATGTEGGLRSPFREMTEKEKRQASLDIKEVERATKEGVAKKAEETQKAADLARIIEQEEEARIKRNNEATRADERRQKKEDDFSDAQDKLAEELDERRKDILEGKGIGVPERARVDALQAIGGIIGGVAGRGDQAARVAERQAKATEAMHKLLIDSNRKLDEIYRRFDGIVEGA